MFIPSGKTLKKWGSKGFLSVLDQGLFSGSNFLVSILLARWLSPYEYGVFSIAFSIYLFFALILNSITLEPMMIFGSTYFKEKVTIYIKKILHGHIILSIILSVIFLLISFFTKNIIKQTFFSAAISLPFMLVIWFYRRTYYIKSNIAQATILSGTYSAFLLFGVYYIKKLEILTPFTIYLIFIIAGISCSIYYRFSNHMSDKSNFLTMISNEEILKIHWNYGKWIILASIASSITTLLYIPILGLVSSVEEAAAFKAIQNLISPFQQTLAAFSLLILPKFSRIIHNQSKYDLKINLRNIILFFLILTIFYSTLLYFFGNLIIKFLYTNNYYLNYTWLIPIFIFMLIIMSVGFPIAISLRALEKPKKIWSSKFYSALSFIIIGIFLIPYLKLKGILICMIISSSVETIILSESLNKELITNK